MKFTDKTIKNLKPKENRYIVWEENAHGQGTLGMRVSTAGTRSWIVMYFFQGRARMLTLGTYPKMPVAQAHKEHAEAVTLLENGEDPGAKAVTERSVFRKSPTVKDLVKDYLEKWAEPRKRSWKDDERILNREVIKAWGDRKARNIVRADVIALLDGIVERGAPIAANRTLALVRKMFSFAASRDIVPVSPCHGVSAPSKEHRRERVLNETEIHQLLVKLAGTKMSKLSQLAIRLQLLTAQRCSEVLGAEWPEINLDFGWWTIPAEKAKNSMAHRVPLSRQAIAVLKQAQAMSRGETHVFPSPRGDRPMKHTVLSRAVRRSVEVFGIVEWTPHDLRRTAASHMTSIGISRLVVSKILNHAERGVTAVYDRHSYDAEKREALEIWGKKVAKMEKAKMKLKIVDGTASKESPVKGKNPSASKAK